MTDKQIKKLIDFAAANHSEFPNVEFKDATGGMPTDIWKVISAFSHRSDGGIVVFGVNEDPATRRITVVGLKNLQDLQEKLSNLVRDVMHNPGFTNFFVLDYRGKTVLVLEINGISGEQKPCYNKRLGLPRGAYIRDGITNREISDDEMRTLVRESSNVYKFDKTIAIGTSSNQLSLDKLSELLVKTSLRAGRGKPRTNPSNTTLYNIGVVDKVSSYEYKPTVAGFLIFSKNEPQLNMNFNRYIIRCIRYQGADASSPIIDKLDIRGTLDDQINEMQKFILKNISVKADIIGTKRVERSSYPEDAIREVVANAVIHRDYTITQTYTQVSIYANRIEISNPGNLPPGVTIENIKGSQFSRNEIIAALLRDLDYLEEYGRGIDIVFSRMSEYGLLPPLFKNASNQFKVILLGEHFNDLNERQVRIWQKILDTKQCTAKNIREMLHDVSKPTISNDLKKLTDTGLIIPIGKSINTYYEAKY